MSRLSLRDVVVGYDANPVLRGVSFDVPHGSLAAVVGPSGCGKTTMLRTIAGLARAQSGEIRLGRRMLTTHGVHLVPEKRRIGWVPQDAVLFPHLTVAENIAFGLGTNRRAMRRAARGERVHHLLELVGLLPLADRTPAQLSGGQAQRVALARALAVEPEAVLLDEPFGALDPVLRADLRAEVRGLLASVGTTGVLVTHDQAEALSIGDYVVVMDHGRVLQVGRPDEVYTRPTTPWVAAFVGESVLLEGVWLAGHVTTSLSRFPADWTAGAPRPADGDTVQVLIRPEQIEAIAVGHRNGSSPDGANGHLPGIVTSVHYAGHDALLGLLLHNGTRCTARVQASGLLTAGTEALVRVNGAALAYPLED